MLNITIPAQECFDEELSEFFYLPAFNLNLEHSLLSVSKWESRWNKPFLDNRELTKEEFIDYIRCMTINSNVDPRAYYRITNSDLLKIKTYIDSPMTATTFSTNKNAKVSREKVTSELIYYWMVAAQIPFEAQKWHLNRLLTLIRICDIKSSKPEKMSKKDIYSRNTALNKARRAKMGSKG